jgi:hypothetical protein
MKELMLVILGLLLFTVLALSENVDVNGTWEGTMTVTDKGSGHIVLKDDAGKEIDTIPIKIIFDNGKFTCITGKDECKGNSEEFEKKDENTYSMKRFDGEYTAADTKINMKFSHGDSMGYFKGSYTGFVSGDMLKGIAEWIFGASIFFKDKLKFDFEVTKKQ